MANLLPVLLVSTFLVLELVVVRGQQYSSGSWLETCVLDEAAVAQLVCKVAGNIRLAKERAALAVDIPQHLLILGQPDEHAVAAPKVDFAGGLALYNVLPNASVTIRRLLLASALLPEAYPLPTSSFLAIRAFNATARSAPGAASPVATAGALSPVPPPPLRLEDVSIVTPSCVALAVHQDFACRASPSPNFTVTPRSLHVLSYDSPTVQARNLTLTCSGAPLPYPCTAYIASSARELAATLSPPPTTDGSPDAPVYILLSQSMALADAWGSRPAPTEAFRRPITIAGMPASLASPTPTTPTDNATTFHAPPTVLDLSGTQSLLPLAAGARLQLHNMTLVNPPYGLPGSYPSGLLTLPLWTFDFMRHSVGQDKQWRLLGRGLAVALPAEELALWHADLTGTVPQELAGCLCALDSPIFKSQSAAVPLPGGGLFLPDLRTPYTGLQMFEDLALLPAPGFARAGAGGTQSGCRVGTEVGMGAGATGPPAARAVPVSPTVSAARSAPTAPPQQLPRGAGQAALPPLCALRLDRSAAPAFLQFVDAYEEVLTPAAVTRYTFLQRPTNVFSLVLLGDTAFRKDVIPANDSFAYMSFALAQAQLVEDQLWLGDPLGPRLLHLSFVPAAVNLRGHNGSLLLRQLVLAGLPPAGLHPRSEAYVTPPAAVPRSPPPAFQAAGASARAPPFAPPLQPEATAAPPAPVGRRMLGAAASGEAAGGRTAPHGAASLAPRRRAQLRWLNVTWVIDGAPAGVDPTAGLPAGLTNLTSCLWSLDLDRTPGVAPLGSGLQRAYLDSVVLLLPPEELALIAAAAAQALAEAAGTDSPVGFAAAAGAAAEAVLSALHGWLAASALAGGTSVASLARLVGRLTGQQGQVQQPASGTAVSSGSKSSSSSSSGTDAAAQGPEEWAALAFDSLSWCGLAGRNVTLAAEPHPTWGAELTANWGVLWSEVRLGLPLRAAVRAPSPPASPPPPPLPEAPSEHAPAPPAEPGWPSRTYPGIASLAVPDAPTLLGSVGQGHSLPPAHSPPPLSPKADLLAGGHNTKTPVAAAAASCCAALGLGGLLLLVLRRAKKWRAACACGSAGMAAAHGGDPEKPSLEAACGHGSGDRFIPGSSGEAMWSSRVESGGTPVGTSSAAARQGTNCDGGSIGSVSGVSSFSAGSGVNGGNAASGGSLPSGGVGRSNSSRGAARFASRSRAPVAWLAAMYQDMDVLSRRVVVSPPLSNDGGGGGGRPSEAESGGDASCSDGLEVLGELGRGAQGVVFHGRWRGLDVAIKSVTFTQSGAATDPRVSRPITEAAISASLSHPHVVATYTHQLCRAEPDPPPLQPPPDSAGRQSSGPRLMQAEEGSGATGGEAAVWRLTLVQELCDGGSLRHWLDSWLLPEAGVPSPPAGVAARPSGMAWVPFGLPWRRVTPAPAHAVPPSSAASTPLQKRRSGLFRRPSAPSVTLALALSDDQQTHDAASPRVGAQAPVAGPALPGTSAPPLSVSLLLALQVARGMAYLHSLGVLHGDLSSANVLLKSAPQPGRQQRESEAQQEQERHQPRRRQSCFPRALFFAGVSSRAGVSAASCSSRPWDGLGGSQAGDACTRRPATPPGEEASGTGDSLQPSSACDATHTGISDASQHSQPTRRMQPLCPSPVGWRYVAKVSDFGLSGRLEAGQTHLSGDCRRSLMYSAPELVQYGTASKASDVYAFAVLLYELVCGASLPALLRHPLRGPGLRAWLAGQEAPGAAAAALPPGLLVWPPGCPAGMAALAAECLAERAAGRPTFEAVCGRLEAELAVCGGGGGGAGPAASFAVGR